MAGRFSVETVFEAIDKITAPVSRMQRRIGRFTQATESNLRRVNRVFSRITKSIRSVGAAVLKFGGIAIGGLTASVALLVREFSKIEDAQAAFTPLLGSAERAKEAVDAINKTAATTPFQFEDLASSVSQLLPVMNGDIENTIKTLRMMGDTAGGNAQKLGSITRGFTKAMLKGKVDMESLNIIAEAGVPIFEDLAAVMGQKTGERFFKTISSGRVTTDKLVKAFERITSRGGKFFQGMEIASKTTSGLFSTLKDNISLTAAEIGGVLAPTIKDFIRQAIGVAERVREWVKANRELIAARFIKFVERARSVIGGLWERLQQLNAQHDLLARLADIIEGVGKAFVFLSRHGATIAKVIAGVVALSLALKVLTAVMTVVNIVMAANPIGLIVIAIAALVAVIASAIIWWDDLKAAFKAFPGPVKAALAVLTGPIGFIIASASKIIDAWEPVKKFFASLGFGDDEPMAVRGPRSGVVPTGVPAAQVISPQDRTARLIEERRTTSSAEITIRDQTRRAEVTRGALGPGVVLQPTGGM